MAEIQSDKIKSTAFGVCGMRTMMSFLPDEAGALVYDKRTPNFEGVALEFCQKGPLSSIESCRKMATAFPTMVERMIQAHGGKDKDWGGLDFGLCRSHTVDTLMKDCITKNSPTKQIVFCGVGQDYRAMRYGEQIQSQDIKVFELDLPPMMALREKVKARIMEVNKGLVLPETYALAIDFDKQSVAEVLLKCPNFDTALPTLYVWEGVSYYLQPEQTKLFLQDIHGLMSRAPRDVQQHHSIFFDHLIDLQKLANDGDKPAAAIMEALSKTEPLLSFVNFDGMATYLSDLGFRIEQQLEPPGIYKQFQNAPNENYNLKGSSYFGMVVAKLK